jgi:hypothetical protein
MNGRRYSKIRERALAERLREVFDVVNDQCFDGKLEVGSIEFRKMNDALAKVITWGVDRKPTIRIHSRLRWCLKLCCHELLHEMVHLAKPEVKHGEEMELEIIKLKHVACIDGNAW